MHLHVWIGTASDNHHNNYKYTHRCKKVKNVGRTSVVWYKGRVTISLNAAGCSNCFSIDVIGTYEEGTWHAPSVPKVPTPMVD